LKEASPKKGLPPDIGVVTKTTRGRRPPTRTKRMAGQWFDPAFSPSAFNPLAISDEVLLSATGSRTTARIAFKKVTDLWAKLNTVQKECWYQKNKADGTKCSTFDYFMRLQLNHWYKKSSWDLSTCVTCSQPAVYYVSPTMTPSQQQTLRVVDPSWAPFSWSIFSGGGGLSSPTGDQVVYTAPPQNPKCSQSAIISVTDRCGLKTFFRITTNSAGTGARAYGITAVNCWQHQPAPSEFEGIETWGPFCYACFVRFYDCQGNYLNTDMIAWMYTDVPWDIAPAWCKDCIPANSKVIDARTPYQIQTGCCPAAIP